MYRAFYCIGFITHPPPFLHFLGVPTSGEASSLQAGLPLPKH